MMLECVNGVRIYILMLSLLSHYIATTKNGSIIKEFKIKFINKLSLIAR